MTTTILRDALTALRNASHDCGAYDADNEGPTYEVLLARATVATEAIVALFAATDRAALATADADQAPSTIDPVVEKVRESLLQRSQLGIKKYGDTLHNMNYSEREILQHAIEESMDLSNYLMARIMKIDAEAAALAAPIGEAAAKVIEGGQIRFLANGKDSPRVGTLLYTHPAAEHAKPEPVVLANFGPNGAAHWSSPSEPVEQVKQAEGVMSWQDRMAEHYAKGSVQCHPTSHFMALEISDWRGQQAGAVDGADTPQVQSNQ